MKLDSSIIIAGPTTTGKSEISEILARRLKGAIINTDNYYFYASEVFHIGLGLAKGEPDKDIPHYLYGILRIDQPKPNPEAFFQLAIGAAQKALDQDLIPIFQGCSYTLNAKLIKAGFTNRVFAPVWQNTGALDDRIRQRVEQMLKEGLLDEGKEIIQQDQQNSWIATEGIIYRPTIEYLEHKLQNKHAMVEAIARGIKAKAMEQRKKYQKLTGVNWIVHNNSPKAAAKEIIHKIHVE